MNRNYVVTLSGIIPVDITVAVIAKSEEEAQCLALQRADRDTSGWLHHNYLVNDPVVTDVSEETQDEIQCADQQHLVGPRLH
jgi:hypothetical protein